MNKKLRKTAPFFTLIWKVLDEQGNEVEETLHKQGDIEEEVHNYYEKLYKHSEVKHMQDEILEQIGNDIKKILIIKKRPSKTP